LWHWWLATRWRADAAVEAVAEVVEEAVGEAWAEWAVVVVPHRR